jgi:hypothetical protein
MRNCCIESIIESKLTYADPGVRAVYVVSLRSLACWDCGFEFLRGHRFLSLVSVVCCHVEVSRRAEYSSRGILSSEVCLSDREASAMRRPWPNGGTSLGGKKQTFLLRRALKCRHTASEDR